MEFIQYYTDQHIGYLTLNRPEKRNALNQQMVSELISALHEAEKDESVKIILLRAKGKVFCAGADLQYLQQLQKNTFEENHQDSLHLKNLFKKIYTLNKIVVAQVHGHALAGGCGLAAICDISFTVPEAKFGYTEVKIGFIPAIVSYFLLRKIGEARAKELLLGGEQLSAETALKYGLVNFVVNADDLEEEVTKYIQMLVSTNSAEAMSTTKKMLVEIQDKPLEEALNYAARMNALARESEDCKKGIASFLNKEPLNWIE